MPHSELVQSVLRSIDVIELVSQSDRGLTLSEVCDSLGLKQPTAHNLIRTLVAREFVEKTTSPVRYRLGPALARLAEERSGHSIVRRASSAMGEVFEKIRAQLPPKLTPQDEASLSFSQPVGGEIVMTLRLRMQRLGVLERPRHVFGPYQSAASLTFQAFWSQEDQESYRRRHPFMEQGAPTWKTLDRLEAFLAKSRQLGYVHPPIFPEGQFRAAVPVYDEGHELIGALGVGLWLKEPFESHREIVKLLIDSAKNIGAAE